MNKKRFKFIISLMMTFVLCFSCYSVTMAQEPSVTDNTDTIVEEIIGEEQDQPQSETNYDQVESDDETELANQESTDIESGTGISEEDNENSDVSVQNIEEELVEDSEEVSEQEETTILEGTPVPEIEGVDYAISKSKTATQLDENYETQVTLSLPAGEEQLVSDIVFVLDKSTSTSVQNSALDMLSDLKVRLDETNAKINVGIVIFNKEATTYGWYDLSTQYADIEDAMRTTMTSGTNTHAGLLAAEDMLSDTSVSDSRKYMIFVSDGITYMYDSNPKAIYTQTDDGGNPQAGPDCWSIKNGSNNAPSDWGQYLENVQKYVSNDTVATYTVDYTGGTKDESAGAYVGREDNKKLPTTVDVALLNTYNTYQRLSSKYHCYAMRAQTDSGSQYLWGPSFMDFLADDEQYSFDSIKNDIYYLVDAGSYVTDYIGYTSDYNFDFVNDASALSLKVGDQIYQAVSNGNGTYSFANGNYVLDYEPGNMADGEMFTFTTNVPISQFAPVQLTYTLKLTNPKMEPGTYGQYDANGSLGYDGLYTNNSATLIPVDTNGQPGSPEEFARPTVSYTVEAQPEEQPSTTDEEKPSDENKPNGGLKEDKKDSESTKGTDTATQTNVGLMVSLASVAASGAAFLVVLKKKRV